MTDPVSLDTREFVLLYLDIALKQLQKGRTNNAISTIEHMIRALENLPRDKWKCEVVE